MLSNDQYCCCYVIHYLNVVIHINTHDTYLIRGKVAAFIITGGQDNIQHVAGELICYILTAWDILLA
jgi:hypothetical protein